MYIVKKQKEIIVHLTNPDILEFINISENVSEIPINTCGVYFLYGKEKDLIYVGYSQNIRGRISMHKRCFGNGIFAVQPQVNPKEIFYAKFISEPGISSSEQFYIKTFSPKRNHNWFYYELQSEIRAINPNIELSPRIVREYYENKVTNGN